MLDIRPEQLEILAAQSTARWLRGHARRHFPQHCEVLGEDGLEAFLSQSLERARGYGFSDTLHQVLFVDLSFVLGAGFENKPDYPWARRILDDPQIAGAAAKIAALRGCAVEHLQALKRAESSEPRTTA